MNMTKNNIKIIQIITLLLLSVFLNYRYGYASNYEKYKDEKVIMSGEDNGVIAKLVYGILLIIENNGDSPIEFNYSADKCYYITTEGKQYLMELVEGDMPYYGDGMATLNPDKGTSIMFYREQSHEFVEKYNQGKIAELLLIINYGKTRIYLKPINNSKFK